LQESWIDWRSLQCLGVVPVYRTPILAVELEKAPRL
jgi:hypothetical protein